MKVLLTTLPSPFLDSDKAFPQLGILYLLSAAKEAGFRVQFVENPSVPIEEDGVYYTDIVFQTAFAYDQYDAIAISAVTPQGGLARDLLNVLKDADPLWPVLIGGPHATHYSQECLDAGFDYVVAGDGEDLFLHFLCNGLKGGLTRDTLSCDYLNRLPRPLREKEYLGRYTEYQLQGRKATSIIVSRGCPNMCAFCEDASTPMRWYTPERFEEEILDIKAAGFNAVMIYDDLFAVNPRKVRPYADILKKHDVIYRCFTHARSVSRFPELPKILADTGCVAVGFGAESMDDGILEVIHKRTTGDMNRICVCRCAAAGLNVKSFFMLGLPGETPKTAKKMYEFIKWGREHYPDLYDFDSASIYFPFKGTEIGDSLRAGETRFDLKLIDGLTWEDVDRDCLGAHKSSGGGSDHITETQGLSCNALMGWQEKMLELSKRFDGRELREGVFK